MHLGEDGGAEQLGWRLAAEGVPEERLALGLAPARQGLRLDPLAGGLPAVDRRGEVRLLEEFLPR